MPVEQPFSTATAIRAKPGWPKLLRAGTLANGLIHAYPWSEGGGTTCTDLVGGSQSAMTLAAAPAWRKGRAGWALNFNGSSQYGTFSDVGMPSGSAPRALAIWFKTTGTTTAFRQLINYGTLVTNGTTQVAIDTTGHLAINTWNQTNRFSTGTFNDGIWHLAVASFDGTTWICYVDGVPVITTSALPMNTVLSGSVRVGVRPDATAAFFSGDLDAPLLWNRPLTVLEVGQLTQDPFAWCRQHWNWATTEVTWLKALTGSDTLTAAESPSLAAALTSPDTAAAAEGTPGVGLTGSDTLAAAEGTPTLAAALAGSEAFAAAEGTPTLAAALATSEAFAAAEGTPGIGLTGSDAFAESEATDLAAALADSESFAAAEATPGVALATSDAFAESEATPALNVPGDTTIATADSATLGESTALAVLLADLLAALEHLYGASPTLQAAAPGGLHAKEAPRKADPASPYLVMARTRNHPELYTDATVIYDTHVRVRTHATSIDAAIALGDSVLDAFKGQSFTFTSGWCTPLVPESRREGKQPLYGRGGTPAYFEDVEFRTRVREAR